METRIIMTEVTSPHGRYTKFTVKGTGKFLAEVDRRDGKYIVFAGAGVFHEVFSHRSKPVAFKYVQDWIRTFIPDAEFKYNVMTERIRY